MQNAPDRDSYIRILWENIAPEYYDAFNVADKYQYSQYGIPYDLNSLMHYRSYAYSMNGKDTMVPLDGTKSIHSDPALSDYDVARVKAMYNCN